MDNSKLDFNTDELDITFGESKLIDNYKANCILNGSNVSIIGEKYIEFDFLNNTITIEDNGGLFAKGFKREYPYNQVNILPKVSLNFVNSVVFKFTVEDLSGRFSSTDELFISSIIHSIKSPDENKSIIAYKDILDTDEVQSEAFFIGLKKEDLVLYSLRENVELRIPKASLNYISLEDGLLVIKTQAYFNNQLLNTISIPIIYEPVFFNNIFSILSCGSSRIRNQNSYSCNVNGFWLGHNYTNEECVVTIYPSEIKIYSISQETYIDINLNDIVFLDHHNDSLVLFNNFPEETLLLSGIPKDIINENYKIRFHFYKDTFYLDSRTFYSLNDLTTLYEFTVIDLEHDKIILNKQQEIFYSDINSLQQTRNGLKFSYLNKNLNLLMKREQASALEHHILKENKDLGCHISKYDYIVEKEERYLKNAQKYYFNSEDILINIYESIEEPMSLPDFLGKSVLVNEEQFPNVWNKVVSISRILSINPPQVFIYDSFFYKCDNEGINIPRIEITTRVIEDFNDSELTFVLASCLAHIALEHNEQQVIMNGILGLIPNIGSLPFLNLGNYVKVYDYFLMKLKINYYMWARAAVLSADRFGYLCSASADDTTTAILKMILNSSKLVDQLNLNSFLLQKEKLNAIRGVAAFYTKVDESVPYGVDRILNILRYSESPLGKVAMKKTQLITARGNYGL